MRSLNPRPSRPGLLRASTRAQAPKSELRTWREEPTVRRSQLWMELAQRRASKLLQASSWRMGCSRPGHCAVLKLEADVARLQGSPEFLPGEMPAQSLVRSRRLKTAQAQELVLVAEPKPKPGLPLPLRVAPPARPLAPAMLVVQAVWVLVLTGVGTCHL